MERGTKHSLYVSRRREPSISYKGVETSPLERHFKNLEGKPERKSRKRTISGSDGLELQHILERAKRGQYVRCAWAATDPPVLIYHTISNAKEEQNEGKGEK